jgi:sugar lactone lactonase YvrE
MRYLLLALFSIGLMVPLACMNTSPTAGTGQRSSPLTSTPTNLNGWTSTPTATLEATPAFIATVSTGITAPNGLAYASPYIYVAEGDGASVSEVQVLTTSNTVHWTWTGSGSTLFQFPNGVAVNSAGTTVYVLDLNPNSGAGTVYAVAPAATATPITSWTSYNGTALSSPGGIALDSSGNVYVADTDNSLLEEFSPSGTSIASWTGSGDFEPVAVAVDSANNVYVADGGQEKLWVVKVSGSSFTVTTDWRLPENPYYANRDYYGLTLDAAPNVYVADYYNSQVEVYNSTGTFLGQFNGSQIGSTALSGPDALLLYNSDIYVADNDSNLLEIFGPNNYH